MSSFRVKSQRNLEENSDKFPWFDPTGGWRKIRVAWQKSLLKRLQGGGKPSPLVVPLQVLALNGTYWVTLPGESFVEVGLMIQDRFPDQTVFIVGYADDTRMGYIRIKEAYLEGGYEVDAAFRYCGLDLPIAWFSSLKFLINHYTSWKTKSRLISFYKKRIFKLLRNNS